MGSVCLLPVYVRGYEVDALVDPDVYEWAKDWKWCLTAKGYVSGRRPGERVPKRLHRLVMNAPEGLDVDHINGNKLDNRRCNLRIATRTQNMANFRRPRVARSGYIGVYAYPRNPKKWQVRIRYQHRFYTFGPFHDKVEAARFYNAKAIEFFGEFATLNKVE